MYLLNNKLIDRTWNDVQLNWWKGKPSGSPNARTNVGKALNVKQVRVTSDNQKIPSSDWPKWRCTLWRYVTFLSGIERYFKLSVDTLIEHQIQCKNPSINHYIDNVQFTSGYRMGFKHLSQLYKTWIKDIQWLNHGYLQNPDNFLAIDCIKKDCWKWLSD